MKKKKKAVSLNELKSVFATAASASKAKGGSQKNSGSGGTAEGTGTCEIGGTRVSAEFGALEANSIGGNVVAPKNGLMRR